MESIASLTLYSVSVVVVMTFLIYYLSSAKGQFYQKDPKSKMTSFDSAVLDDHLSGSSSEEKKFGGSGHSKSETLLNQPESEVEEASVISPTKMQTRLKEFNTLNDLKINESPIKRIFCADVRPSKGFIHGGKMMAVHQDENSSHIERTPIPSVSNLKQLFERHYNNLGSQNNYEINDKDGLKNKTNLDPAEVGKLSKSALNLIRKWEHLATSKRTNHNYCRTISGNFSAADRHERKEAFANESDSSDYLAYDNNYEKLEGLVASNESKPSAKDLYHLVTSVKQMTNIFEPFRNKSPPSLQHTEPTSNCSSDILNDFDRRDWKKEHKETYEIWKENETVNSYCRIEDGRGVADNILGYLRTDENIEKQQGLEENIQGKSKLNDNIGSLLNIHISNIPELDNDLHVRKERKLQELFQETLDQDENRHENLQPYENYAKTPPDNSMGRIAADVNDCIRGGSNLDTNNIYFPQLNEDACGYSQNEGIVESQKYEVNKRSNEEENIHSSHQIDKYSLGSCQIDGIIPEIKQSVDFILIAIPQMDENNHRSFQKNANIKKRIQTNEGNSENQMRESILLSLQPDEIHENFQPNESIHENLLSNENTQKNLKVDKEVYETQVIDGIHECFKTKETIHEKRQPNKSSYQNLQPDENIQESHQPDENIQKNLQPNKNIHKSLQPNESTPKNVKLDKKIYETQMIEGIHESFKPKENIHEELQPNKRRYENLQPDENIQLSLQLNEDIQETFQPNENIQERLQINENIQKILQLDKEVYQTQVIDGIHESLKIKENIHEELQPNRRSYENLQPDENIQLSLQLNEDVQETLQPNENIQERLQINENIQKILQLDKEVYETQVIDGIHESLKIKENIHEELQPNKRSYEPLQLDENIQESLQSNKDGKLDICEFNPRDEVKESASNLQQQGDVAVTNTISKKDDMPDELFDKEISCLHQQSIRILREIEENKASNREPSFSLLNGKFAALSASSSDSNVFNKCLQLSKNYPRSTSTQRSNSATYLGAGSECLYLKSDALKYLIEQTDFHERSSTAPTNPVKCRKLYNDERKFFE